MNSKEQFKLDIEKEKLEMQKVASIIKEKGINKSLLRELSPKPYYYSGQWDNLYHFTKGDNRNGFYLVSCNKNDILSGDFLNMCKIGFTRI